LAIDGSLPVYRPLLAMVKEMQCREPGEHFRGRWLVDRLLVKASIAIGDEFSISVRAWG
jgi:hypothetical protein